MNRRDVLKAGIVAAAVPASVLADESALVRVSMEETDIGYYPALPMKKITILLDGKDVGNDYLVSTINERGGFVIGLRDSDEVGLDFKKIDGNFTIGGLTREERLAHIDTMRHRVLMGDTTST